MSETPILEKSTVFEARTGGFHNYRIPSLLLTGEGTLLAFCEARKGSGSDWDPISLVLRRSEDGGRSWGEAETVVEGGGAPAHNMTGIADSDGRTLHYLFCRGYERAYYMKSADGGRTFSSPADITPVFEEFRKDYNWAVVATGPGHGVRLSGGRLVVPVWLSLGTGGNRHRPSVVSSIYSDDGGASWSRGEILPDTLLNPSETSAVELSDGRVLFNIRNEQNYLGGRRAYSIGPDGATGWSRPRFHPKLPEPCCLGCLAKGRADGPILFCNPASLKGANPQNPASKTRRRLTVRASFDDCLSFPVSRVIEEGISAYSDVAISKDGRVFCLYECGGMNGNAYDSASIRLASFPMEWLTDNPIKQEERQ